MIPFFPLSSLRWSLWPVVLMALVALGACADAGGETVQIRVSSHAAKVFDLCERRPGAELPKDCRSEHGLGIQPLEVGCAAKISCEEALLHHPLSGERVQTLVTGWTCGADSEKLRAAMSLSFQPQLFCCRDMPSPNSNCGWIDLSWRHHRTYSQDYGDGPDLAVNMAWELDSLAGLFEGGPLTHCYFEAFGDVGVYAGTSYAQHWPLVHWKMKLSEDPMYPNKVKCEQAEVEVEVTRGALHGPTFGLAGTPGMSRDLAFLRQEGGGKDPQGDLSMLCADNTAWRLPLEPDGLNSRMYPWLEPSLSLQSWAQPVSLPIDLVAEGLSFSHSCYDEGKKEWFVELVDSKGERFSIQLEVNKTGSVCGCVLDGKGGCALTRFDLKAPGGYPACLRGL